MVATPTQRIFASCEEDLRWYFNEAPGELGLHSNYPPMVLRLIVGGDAPRTIASYELGEGEFDAARRARRISHALKEVSEATRAILHGSFGVLVPAALRRAYRELAWLAPRTKAAVEAYQDSNTTRSFEDWLARLPRRGQDDLVARRALEQVQLEAGMAYLQAMLEYRAVRREVRHG